MGMVLVFCAGCTGSFSISRAQFLEEITKICRERFQARVTAKAVGDTLWVYLPYTPGRGGAGVTEEKDRGLFVEYRINSFNPYKVVEPPELKFVVEKVVGRIRALELRCANPYTFFVLVVTDISDPKNSADQYYMGYFPDLKKYRVGKDFSGEGYSRLTWSQEKVATPPFRDGAGRHVNYHEVTLKEFVLKQIPWRIYKRFTVEYNKIPYDLTAAEKKEEIIHIVKTVLSAYNFKEFKEIYFKDSSFLEESEKFLGYDREDLEKYPAREITRRPGF